MREMLSPDEPVESKKGLLVGFPQIIGILEMSKLLVMMKLADAEIFKQAE